ncbi:uncharacterized protein V1518DRAFT_409430 [Limtongia smithiae]|uniref:uncharacterized protein n=1 Tax=Limtongia smithiae TaxID=1125753 RepID=UPI0034CF510D
MSPYLGSPDRKRKIGTAVSCNKRDISKKKRLDSPSPFATSECMPAPALGHEYVLRNRCDQPLHGNSAPIDNTVTTSIGYQTDLILSAGDPAVFAYRTLHVPGPQSPSMSPEAEAGPTSQHPPEPLKEPSPSPNPNLMTPDSATRSDTASPIIGIRDCLDNMLPSSLNASYPPQPASHIQQRPLRITYSMGYRADCPKCRAHESGHYSHIISR